VNAGIITPYRPRVRPGHSGFAQLLHSEWTKLRTVRGWIIGLLLVPVMTVGFGAFISSSSECGSMAPGPAGQLVSVPCTAPVGPGGGLVEDQFYFVHQPVAGNGTITARVTALTSSSLQPWAKAGVIIKANTAQGSAYAAMMVTGAHGVRMQWNYTQDTPGMTGPVSAASPRWLRLVRSGDTVTGYDSADGLRWNRVGTVTLAGLPTTVQAGMFATSPQPSSGAQRQEAGHAIAVTGTLDHAGVAGAAAGRWEGTSVGARPIAGGPAGFQQTASGFAVTGNGDIAPDVGSGAGSTGTPVSHTLAGLFLGLIVAIVIGAMFVTAEYRRGMIRTTLTASPGRGRVLAAKATVAGAVTFAGALIGCAISVPLGERLLRDHGNVIEPVSALTAVRVVAGTALVFTAAAVLAVALGVIFRRGAAAVTTAIVVIVIPWFLAVSSPALSTTAADWLLRVFPSAALAVQQTFPRYPQVNSPYHPFDGFYPLSAWAGFAVLLAWTGAALWLAVFLLRRRDA